jgi:hypothetical protein
MLHALAESGMRAWNCSNDMLDTLDGAFEDITFRAMSVAALERFAVTADEKISLSPPNQTSMSRPATAPTLLAPGNTPRPRVLRNVGLGRALLQ